MRNLAPRYAITVSYISIEIITLTLGTPVFKLNAFKDRSTEAGMKPEKLKCTRAEFVKLWKNQTHRDLPFRFGYPDAAKHNHLMITRPKPSGTK